MVDTELVEMVRSGYLEHEGGGRGRLRVTRDPRMLKTLRYAGPVAENKMMFISKEEDDENIIKVCV